MADVISTLSQNDTSANTSNGGEWYTDAQTWESAAQTRHATTPNREILECYADWSAGYFDGSMSIADWAGANTTDYPLVRAAPGHEHKGVFDGGFKFSTTGIGSVAITIINIGYAEVQDIQIENRRGSGLSGDCMRWAANSKIERCIFNRARSTGNNGRGIVAGSSGQPNNGVLRNCLFIGCADSIVRASGITATIDNCTFIDFGEQALDFSDGTITVNNCVAYSVAPIQAAFDSPAGFTYTTCASNDGSAGTTVIDSTAFVDYNADPSLGDYNPAPSGLLDGTGTDLSGTFTDDITGQTRTQWDIGAYGRHYLCW
jgi:hypothetical protein